MSSGTYLQDILNSVKDEPDVLRKLSETIVKYSNMTEKELQEQIKGINKGLQQAEQEKQFVIDVYKSQDCSKLVDISEDGKVIKTTGENAFTIEDESLKEKIFAQLYFQERQGSEDKFVEKVSNFYSDGKTDFKFGKTTDTPLARKKVFSAMKVTARQQGYAVLNSLEECESGDNIQIQAVEAQKGKPVSFQDLKSIYQKLDIFYKDDDYTKLYVKDRVTGKEIIDPQLQTMGRFAAIWAGAAGTKWMSDEEIRGITYAFNEPSERVFSKLGELVGKSMTEKGTIDTESIYKAISDDSYKHSEEIVRTLLSNPASMKIVYDFYKMQNDDEKLETRLAKSTNEILYGYSAEDSLVADKLEDMMISIPNAESRSIPEQPGGEINEFGEIIRPVRDVSQVQEQSDMVTLPNGIQIPRKQYEEEQGTKKQSTGISIGDVKTSVSKGKVTTQETQNATQDMKKLMEIKRLQVMQRTGQALTPEQKLMLDERIRQTQQAQIQFQQRQDNRKHKGNGLEM